MAHVNPRGPIDLARRVGCDDLDDTLGIKGTPLAVAGKGVIPKEAIMGRDPDPKRLAAALKYWKVGAKREGAKR